MLVEPVAQRSGFCGRAGRKTADAALKGLQIRDMGEMVPGMMAAAAGIHLRFRVRVAVGKDAPDNTRAALDKLLARVSESPKAE